jgi:hypothetical protein
VAGSYNPAVRSVGPLTTNRTENFTLTMNSITCNAPGYQLTTTALPNSSTGFEGTTGTALPAGWANATVTNVGAIGTPIWVTVGNGTNPTNTPHAGTRQARFNSYLADAGDQARFYRTAGEDLSAATGAQVSFWLYRFNGSLYDPSDDLVQLQLSTDGGTTWNNVGIPADRYDSTLAANTGRWQQYTYDLSQFTGLGMTNVRIGLLGISAYGYYIYVDDIAMTSYTCTPQPGGLVIGNVYDASTLTPLSGATVAEAGGITTTDSSGFYTLFSPSGSQTFTATMTGYTTGVTTANIVPSITQRIDFNLLFNTTEITWTGSTSTNWFVASNWNPAAVPTTTDSVVIPTTPIGNRWPIVTGTATIYNLTLRSGAVLTVSQGVNLYVNGLVANNGALAQIKDVPASATTEFLHITNFGGAVDKYHGVDLTPAGAMGVTTVQVKGNQAACTTNSSDPIIQRCYRIDPTTQTGATVRFWFTNAELNGQLANALKLWHWGPWTQVGTSGNYTYSESGTTCTSGGGLACWFQSTGVSSYSPFALGSGSSPTALRLTKMEARSVSWLPVLMIGALAIVSLSLGLKMIKRRQA